MRTEHGENVENVNGKEKKDTLARRDSNKDQDKTQD